MDKANFLARIKGKIDISKLSTTDAPDKWCWLEGAYCRYYTKRNSVYYTVRIALNILDTYWYPCLTDLNCTSNPPTLEDCVCLQQDGTLADIPDYIANEMLATLPMITPTFSLILHSGWNAISLPLIPENSRPEKVFESILSELESVWTYQKDTWYVYTPGAGYDTITEIKFGEGYEVNMKIPAGETRILPLYGTLKDKLDPIFVQPKADSTTGWYMIGAPYGSVKIKDVIAPSLRYGDPDASYDIGIKTLIEWSLLTKEDTLEAGTGYWLGTNVDTFFAATNTLLTLDIIDASGNSITETWVDDTIYAIGTLTDTNAILINNEEVVLLLNGEETGLSAVTVNGKYRIPYTITTPTTKIFKTKYRGTIA